MKIDPVGFFGEEEDLSKILKMTLVRDLSRKEPFPVPFVGLEHSVGDGTSPMWKSIIGDL